MHILGLPFCHSFQGSLLLSLLEDINFIFKQSSKAYRLLITCSVSEALLDPDIYCLAYLPNSPVGKITLSVLSVKSWELRGIN